MKNGTARKLAALAGAVSGALGAYIAVRPRFLHWGATDEERHRDLPGDDIVEDARYTATRAVTIEAPPEAVWPWLAQMGQTRGGFYSYEWLENLFGLNIHNADRVIPELQHLRPGDLVPLAPGNRLALQVETIEPPHTLVLRTPGNLADHLAEGHVIGTWTFAVEPLDEESSRLIVRWRSTYRRTALGAIANRYALEPVHFLMERKMLLGIKARAERAFLESGVAPHAA